MSFVYEIMNKMVNKIVTSITKIGVEGRIVHRIDMSS